MKTFFTRLGSAIVFSILMIGGMTWTEHTYAILWGVVGLGCTWEYLLHTFRKENAGYGFLPRVLLTITAMLPYGFMVFDRFMADYRLPAPVYLFIYAACLLVALATEILRQSQRPFLAVSQAAIATVYVTTPMMALFYIGFIGGNFSYMWTLSIMLLIWCNDTMAYLIGWQFGKRPFSPVISPKKTWEGTIGGVICTVFAALLISYAIPGISVAGRMGIGLVIGVFATIGDLLESLWKRSIPIKDSGRIMPGHGGFLDRFDSFIFIAPFAALLIYFLTL